MSLVVATTGEQREEMRKEKRINWQNNIKTTEKTVQASGSSSREHAFSYPLKLIKIECIRALKSKIEWKLSLLALENENGMTKLC